MASTYGPEPLVEDVVSAQRALTLADYMTLARELQECCRGLSKVKGAQKLERRIGTEIKFFQTLSRKDEATQAAHLQSSNLSHFGAIVHAATHLPDVTDVMRPFTLPDRRESLVVDVVADRGRSWVKVVARKGQALHLVWAGQGQYGERDMVQQLQEYAECASHHPVTFHPPHVHATFYNTLTSPMACELQGQGVKVWGKVVPVDPGVLNKLMALEEADDEEEEFFEKEDEEYYEDCVVDNGGDEDECLTDFVVDGGCDEGSEGADVHKHSAVAQGEPGDKKNNTVLKEGEVESDICLDVESHGGTVSLGDQDLDVSIRGVNVRRNVFGDCKGIQFRDNVEIRGGDFPIKYREDACCQIVDDKHVLHRLHKDACVRRVSDVSRPQNQQHPWREAVDAFPAANGDSTGQGYTTSTVSATAGGVNVLAQDLGARCRGFTPQEMEGNDLETSELETDSADAREETLDISCGGYSQTTIERTTTTAWSLSRRSRHCLSRILTSCPQYHEFVSQASTPPKSTSAERGKGREGQKEKVNLDITTLITLVSSVCHGGCHFRFKDKVLDQQAAEEREHPSLPDLQQYLEGKEMLVCRTAWSDFDGIVQLLGGPTEKRRAEQLLNVVTIVEDSLSTRAAALKLKGKIKDRSKAIFGTGDELQAVTVTANSGFVRAAESQGVSFAVHMHPARALTEQKERTATPLH